MRTPKYYLKYRNEYAIKTNNINNHFKKIKYRVDSIFETIDITIPIGSIIIKKASGILYECTLLGENEDEYILIDNNFYHNSSGELSSFIDNIMVISKNNTFINTIIRYHTIENLNYIENL